MRPRNFVLRGAPALGLVLLRVPFAPLETRKLNHVGTRSIEGLS